MKKSFTATFDVRGLEIWRLFKLMRYSNMFPLGNFGTGAGNKCLLVLSVLHTFGKPLFKIYTKYEDRLNPLILKLRRLKG